jgi:malonyl-CoA O-methyltransferase
MHDLGDDMLKAGIKDPVVDMEHITLTYQKVGSLFTELKGIGAQNINANRPAGLMSKSRWQAMLKNYEQFKTSNGLFPATYEAIYGHGWITEQSHLTQTSSNDVYTVKLT